MDNAVRIGNNSTRPTALIVPLPVDHLRRRYMLPLGNQDSIE